MTLPQNVHKFCKDDYTKIKNYELAKADNFFIFDKDAKVNYTKGRTYHHRRKK